ncbi:gamma carbonic anhydrase family protein [Thermogemmatispora tikiterensis]|uniref:Gamma carbonic anhydrase family protein n=1 Tax=Thermogemmatispora tikiterensis TaxID=1825093 RepID=A0A328VIX6_9CHLR|nr:gamma carbonic anhydrase family protein [Thermogemmatispora tikiterensis]RAQ96999.1 gamma carbonic anhydrase family protein [Thermogemmatispora tikiterensis]
MPVLPFNGIWPRIAEDVFIAPGAYVIGDVTIGEGASIWYNSVIRGDTGPIVIGKRTNIQDNCVLHLDADAPLTIGEDCTIGHGCVIHGATLGDRVLLGMKAVVLNHARIGEESMIGACALVSEGKVIPGGVLAFGLPARVVRSLTPEEIEHIRGSAQRYVERAARHREALREAGYREESRPNL